MVTCKHIAWCGARTTTKDFWHPHSTCATCVPSGRLHEPTTGTSMFHTIVIGSFMKIILRTHYTLSFVLTHCKLIALNKAAHIPLLHSFMWRIFYTYSGLFLTCLPHYKLTDDGFTVFFVSDACFFLTGTGTKVRAGALKASSSMQRLPARTYLSSTLTNGWERSRPRAFTAPLSPASAYTLNR